jgi:hypothetical protein
MVKDGISKIIIKISGCVVKIKREKNKKIFFFIVNKKLLYNFAREINV